MADNLLQAQTVTVPSRQQHVWSANAFYPVCRALYAVLLSPEVPRTNKAPMFLALLFKVLTSSFLSLSSNTSATLTSSINYHFIISYSSIKRYLARIPSASLQFLRAQQIMTFWSIHVKTPCSTQQSATRAFISIPQRSTAIGAGDAGGCEQQACGGLCEATPTGVLQRHLKLRRRISLPRVGAP